MKVISSFKINNIDYSIIETNKNEKFIIPHSCFMEDDDDILILEDQFKIIDPENYKRYLSVKEEFNYQDLLKFFKDKGVIPNIEKDKIVNLYIDEYIKNKKEWFIKRKFDKIDYFIVIKKENGKYDLTIKKDLKYNIRCIYNKQGEFAYELLNKVNEYDVYFDKFMFKYKINMINYIKLAFENELIDDDDKINPNEEFTNDEIIEIFKDKIDNFQINEKLINRLVELIDSEIIFKYNFGDKSYYVEIDKVNDKYQLDVFYYNLNKNTSVLSKSGNNAYQLLKDAIYNYESCDGYFMLTSEVNIKKYVESLFK